MTNNTIKTYEEILQEARDGWPGQVGEGRADELKRIIAETLENYSTHTGRSKEEILVALEKARNVNCVNFYQRHNLPLLEGVHMFDTLADFKAKFPSGKYVCPSCEKESTDPYKCTQPDCDWKAYGLFGTAGKGIKVVIKDMFLEHPVAQSIFKPIELS